MYNADADLVVTW